MPMKIALASDHAGFDLKDGIARHLASLGVPFTDFGSAAGEIADYVDTAERALLSVESGAYERAILVCGTGMGMSLVGNKFRGIRATLCWNEYTAEMSRLHNDSNCLTLGGRVLSLELGLKIVDIWLAAVFEGGRHLRRLDKLRAIEERNFKPLQ
jgi:ribose 5-phosphate isomerase B